MRVCDGCKDAPEIKDQASDWAQVLSIAQETRNWALVQEVMERLRAFARPILCGLLLVLLGCSSATVFRYARPDGTVIEAQSAKQQSEEQAKWSIKVGADGSLALDLGTRGTQPVNMTADTLQSILGMIPVGVGAAP